MTVFIVGLIVILTLGYVLISLLYPEWVGMTGKKALEIQKEQQGDSPQEMPSKNK